MYIVSDMFNGRPGRLIMPDDYATGATMALIVYTAGAGEHPGSPSLSTLDLLYKNGGALTVCRDGLLNNVIDPVTGKSYRMAVLALQGRSTIPAQPDELAVILKTLIFPQYNFDLNRVFKTGLSAGGKLTIDACGGVAGNLYAAGVEMSTPGFNIPDWKTNLKGRLLAMHGTSDGGQTPYSNSVSAVDTCNAAINKSAYLYSDNTGHDSWNIKYDPATKYKFPWLNQIPLSIYEWMLSVVSKPTELFTASGTAAGTGGTTPPPPMTATKAVPVVTIVNGAATLDSSTSVVNGGATGSSFSWSIAPAVSFEGGFGGGSNLAIKKATGFKPNTLYTISLQVSDKFGGNDTSAPIKITTDATGSGNNTGGVIVVPPVDPPVPPVTPVTVTAEFDIITTSHVKVTSDGKKEVTTTSEVK